MSVAIVLGGSAGIGRAVVAALADQGYRVGVVARDPGRLREVENAHGGAVAAQAADVADRAQLEAAVDALTGRLGKPEVWVNNAMLTSFSPFRAMTPEEFDRIVAVTFTGQVNGTRLALDRMERGSIVNISSGLSYRPVPFQSAYCAAKHAINGFTSSVRSELIREGRPIAMSLIQLPAVNTPQFDWALNRLPNKPQPAPPVFQPEFAARAVLRAVETGAREVIAGGSVMKLIFGEMAAPGWLDRKLARDGAELQQSPTPEPGGRPSNLFAPVDYPATARGSFGGMARASGLLISGAGARRAVFGGALGAAGLAGLIVGLLLG